MSRKRRRRERPAGDRIPLPPALKAKDPLARGRRGTSVESAMVLAFIAAAIFVHAAVIATAFAAGSAFARREKPPENEPIEVAMVEPPPPEPEPEPPPPPEPEPEEKPIPEKPKKVMPPDPIDVPKEPPPPPDKPAQPVRRVVGLSLESTTEGGGGPSFATGNTRMGQTERIAEAPQEVQALPKPATQEVVKQNRAATRIPTATKSELIKPKPRGGMTKPPYPDLLKSQGIEAEVTVRVRIDVTGKVIEAEVVSPASQPEFNASAKATAEKQQFEPAMRDGKAVEWTISYTYRFRLVD